MKAIIYENLKVLRETARCEPFYFAEVPSENRSENRYTPIYQSLPELLKRLKIWRVTEVQIKLKNPSAIIIDYTSINQLTHNYPELFI
jgi:hypothetical protein